MVLGKKISAKGRSNINIPIDFDDRLALVCWEGVLALVLEGLPASDNLYLITYSQTVGVLLPVTRYETY